MKKIFILTVIFSLVFIQIFLISAESIYSKNYTVSIYEKTDEASFVLQELKYDPYPVNAGEYFDLWVKVQNIGQNDAKNSEFKLINEYPFSTEDNIRDFGIIPGTINGYKLRQIGDTNIESNMVVIKFRVKVDENAKDGETILKIEAKTDKDSMVSKIYQIPISIKKTKTDFDIKVNGINSEGTNLVISNVGDNTAGAVSIDVIDKDGIKLLSEYKPVLLGNLNSGEFTVAHLKTIPNDNAKSLTLKISYLDSSQVRNTLEKTISFDKESLNGICSTNSSKTYMYWIYGLIGFISGVFVMVIVILLISKKKASKSK